jgi:hypothetical protein
MAGVDREAGPALILLRERIHYDGSQMQPHWAYRKTGAAGDSVVAFEGSCDVRPERMLDLEDLRAGSVIRGPHMLHFIVEHFDRDLEKAVLRQRLLAAIAREELERAARRRFERRGDDLYDGPRKLSISIAAPTAVSTKIHFAVNVKESKEAGVPTRGLEAYRIRPRPFARAVMEAYRREIAGVHQARVKARPAT